MPTHYEAFKSLIELYYPALAKKIVGRQMLSVKDEKGNERLNFNQEGLSPSEIDIVQECYQKAIQG